MNAETERIEEFIRTYPEVAKAITVISLARRHPYKTLEDINKAHEKIVMLGTMIIDLWKTADKFVKDMIHMYMEELNDRFISTISSTCYLFGSGFLVSLLREEDGEIKYDNCPDTIRKDIQEVVEGALDKLELYALITCLLGYGTDTPYKVIKLLRE